MDNATSNSNGGRQQGMQEFLDAEVWAPLRRAIESGGVELDDDWGDAE